MKTEFLKVAKVCWRWWGEREGVSRILAEQLHGRGCLRLRRGVSEERVWGPGRAQCSRVEYRTPGTPPRGDAAPDIAWSSGEAGAGHRTVGIVGASGD